MAAVPWSLLLLPFMILSVRCTTTEEVVASPSEPKKSDTSMRPSYYYYFNMGNSAFKYDQDALKTLEANRDQRISDPYRKNRFSSPDSSSQPDSVEPYPTYIRVHGSAGVEDLEAAGKQRGGSRPSFRAPSDRLKRVKVATRHNAPSRNEDMISRNAPYRVQGGGLQQDEYTISGDSAYGYPTSHDNQLRNNQRNYVYVRPAAQEHGRKLPDQVSDQLYDLQQNKPAEIPINHLIRNSASRPVSRDEPNVQDKTTIRLEDAMPNYNAQRIQYVPMYQPDYTRSLPSTYPQRFEEDAKVSGREYFPQEKSFTYPDYSSSHRSSGYPSEENDPRGQNVLMVRPGENSETSYSIPENMQARLYSSPTSRYSSPQDKNDAVPVVVKLVSYQDNKENSHSPMTSIKYVSPSFEGRTSNEHAYTSPQQYSTELDRDRVVIKVVDEPSSSPARRRPSDYTRAGAGSDYTRAGASSDYTRAGASSDYTRPTAESDYTRPAGSNYPTRPVRPSRGYARSSSRLYGRESVGESKTVEYPKIYPIKYLSAASSPVAKTAED